MYMHISRTVASKHDTDPANICLGAHHITMLHTKMLYLLCTPRKFVACKQQYDGSAI